MNFTKTLLFPAWTLRGQEERLLTLTSYLFSKRLRIRFCRTKALTPGRSTSSFPSSSLELPCNITMGEIWRKIVSEKRNRNYRCSCVHIENFSRLPLTTNSDGVSFIPWVKICFLRFENIASVDNWIPYQAFQSHAMLRCSLQFLNLNHLSSFPIWLSDCQSWKKVNRTLRLPDLKLNHKRRDYCCLFDIYLIDFKLNKRCMLVFSLLLDQSFFRPLM